MTKTRIKIVTYKTTSRYYPQYKFLGFWHHFYGHEFRQKVCHYTVERAESFLDGMLEDEISTTIYRTYP